MVQKASSFGPFRNRQYLFYWATGLMSNLGWLIQMVGASWLMTSIGGSPAMVALVQTSIALPVMLFALPAGAVADALGRRTIVLWSQSYLLVVSSTLALCAWFDVLTPLTLLAFTFLIGSGKAVNNPGWQTMASEIVSREDLPQAIALGSVAFNIARTVGPAIGGAIVAGVGAFVAFAVNALANCGVIFVARHWTVGGRRTDIAPEPFGLAISTGIRYVSMSPNLLVVLARGAIFNVGAIAVMALMPLIARDVIGGGADLYGVLLGAFGFGGVLGAFGGARLRQHMGTETLVKLGFVACAAGAALIAVSTVLVLSCLGAALAGASWLVTLSTFNTTVQMSAPRWVVSRAHALYQTACFGGNALGSWVWGSLAGLYSTEVALLSAAGLLVLGALAGLLIGMREFDSTHVDIDAPWKEPVLKLDLVDQSGPIIATIEYHVSEENTEDFLALMAKRRRARLRQGSRGWTLSRDMQEPHIWRERYKTPTWLESRRQHLRRSVKDAALSAQIWALCDNRGEKKIRYELSRDPAAEVRRSKHQNPQPSDF